MKRPDLVPPHAYVPGQTPRHDPAFFEPLHASVSADMGAADLQRSAAWHAGLAWLDAGYYWETHEVLEPVWMQTAPGTPERALVQGIIQIANAALKARMHRPNAVRRLCDIAAAHLDEAAPAGPVVMGVEIDAMRRRIAVLRQEAIPE